MDKLAHAEMLGRDFATRTFLQTEAEGLSKVASSDIDPDYLNDMDAMADEVNFRDYQQKIAHNTGVFNALTKVASALEEGADIEGLYEHIGDAMNKIAMEMPTPDDAQEDEEIFNYLVKGASDMYGALYGVEVDEDVINVAAEQIASEIYGQ